MDRDLVRRDALEAERLSASEPHAARQLAEQVLEASQPTDYEAHALAERALGLAARELNDLELAGAHLRRSIAIAQSHRLVEIAAMSRVRLGYVLSLAGNADEALDELAAAERVLSGSDLAYLRSQRALVLQRSGRIEEALAQYRLAVPVLRRTGLALEEAQALSNRGVLHAYRGDYKSAQSDLERAASLADAAGPGFANAKVLHNLGFIAGRRGNVPEALAYYDRAQDEFALLDQSEAPVLLDRCETLLSVGLHEEALDAANDAVGILESRGAAIDLAEARLMAARAALEAQQMDLALQVGKQAATEFRRHRRAGWRALADYVIARVELTRNTRSTLARIDELALRLADAGWLTHAVDLHLAAARVAPGKGFGADAQRWLEDVARHRRHPSIQIRLPARHAEALLAVKRGDRQGAMRAVRAGLRDYEEYASSLGATELRVHAQGRSTELALVGFELARSSGRIASVFEWAERIRAGAMKLAPVRAPSSGRVAELLEELRFVSTEIEQAALQGAPTEAFTKRQNALERAVRDQVRQVQGNATVGASKPPSLSEVREQLGTRSLIEYLTIDDRLHALCITDRQTSMHELSSLPEVLSEAASLRFSFARLARGRGSAETLETFTQAANHAATRLDELLLAPLRSSIGEGPLLFVPAGRLHHLPWSGLATCEGRVVTVAPSASVWLSATNVTPFSRRGRVTLVAGPGIAHGDAEIERISSIYERAQVFVGAKAKAADVSAALDGAQIAHIAAHGRFRADNPQFSSLQLADGNLTVYDLEALHRSPRLFVLSACESGLTAVRPGNELQGVAAALLSGGAKNLIASVMPVPDETTAQLMTFFHQRLARGEDAPTALMEARADLGSETSTARVTSSAFVCFGA